MQTPKRFQLQAPPVPGAAQPKKLTAGERLRLARQFVARVGGLENARQALAMLTIMSRAA